MRVRLHIDQVVLKGVGAHERGALAATLQREFARRFSVPGAARCLESQDTASAFASDAIRAAISKREVP